MSTIKIAINGFGRIGRIITRLALESSEHSNIEITAINDLSAPETVAHLFKYDSVHGVYPYAVKVEGNHLMIETKTGMKKIELHSQKDPSLLPWAALGVQVVHECTGIFTDKEKASLHLKAGAKKVIISAPSKDADATFVMGVNHLTYNASQHTIISNGSCTTNCLAPVAKVIDDKFGIVRGTMLTIHSYTNDQNILDLPHKDLRRARAAALSMIPSTTGAAKALGLVIPALKGKLDGLSMRVPTPNVSIVDLTCEIKTKTTKEEINQALELASKGELKNILGFEKAPLVSCDYNGNLFSATVDADLTHVIDGNFIKVMAWYDNESAFSKRMLELTQFVHSKGI